MASSDENDSTALAATPVYAESREATTSADGAVTHDTTTMPLSGAITLPFRPTTPASLTTASFPPTAPTPDLLWPVSPHDMATQPLNTLTLLQHDLANLQVTSPWFFIDTPTTLIYDSMTDLFVKTAQVLRIVRDLTSTPPIEALLSEPECAVLVRNVASQLLRFAADSTILSGEYMSLKGTVTLAHSDFLEKDSQR
ncbi:hypothetical protein B9Z65_973 [Elsinoe australis]|uniref:Uncharacterized protein n=1 Tax=Elsinoe australis TaxID=40998 RepID=A0A2P8AK18_9PEZI|nr:hypothetical protein B9Z65_973 [Elsinoe australis]